MIGCPECHSITTGIHKPECRHGIRKREIINRIRALVADQSISTTLIQTSDLEVLCDAADPAQPETGVRERTIEECAKIADQWMIDFGGFTTKHLNAGEFAKEAVLDIADAIRALSTDEAGGVQPSIADCGHSNEHQPHALSLAWQPIETAPQDGTAILGRWNGLPYQIKWTLAYEKWPHEEGGPTFKGHWSAETWDQHMPCSPTAWMPLPTPPRDGGVQKEGSTRDERSEP